MRLRTFFKEKIIKGLSHIVEMLSDTPEPEDVESRSAEELEQLKAEKEKIKQAHEEIRQAAKEIAGDKYNNSQLREILPLVENTEKKLQIAESEKNIKEIKACVEYLNKKIDEVRDKANWLDEEIVRLLSSPEASQIIVYDNPKTWELQIINPYYVLKNEGAETEQPYPAVININYATNEVKTYPSLDKMCRTNFCYAAELLNPYYDAKAWLTDMRKNGIEFKQKDNGYSIVDNIRIKVRMEMDNKAEFLANAVLAKQGELSGMVFNEVCELAKTTYSDRVTIGENKVFIKDDTSSAVLVLNYNDNCISSAYYWNKGDTVKVYDVLEPARGFLDIHDLSYHHLLNSDVMNAFLAAEGTKLSYKTKAMEEMQYIGDRTYSLKDIGVKDPINYAFIYEYDRKDDLEDIMLHRLAAAKKEVETGTIVSYNPYNNSLNYESNGNVLTVTFDEFGGKMDVFFKKEKDLYASKFTIVTEDNISNNTLYNSKDFRNLAAQAGISVEKEKVVDMEH
jgi:hypothetical protein